MISLQQLSLEVSVPVPRVILHPTTMTLSKGESVAIVGPSGAGKTTLASIIGGLQRQTSGSYEFAGRPLDDEDADGMARFRRDYVGFIFQHAHLIPERTALENVNLGLVDPHTPPEIRNQKSLEMLSRVGLANRVHQPASLLSGGELQRVSIARALVKSPRLLVADEPTGALDQRTGKKILNIIYGAASLGMTVVVVTHDKGAASMAGRIIEVVDGVVTA